MYISTVRKSITCESGDCGKEIKKGQRAFFEYEKHTLKPNIYCVDCAREYLTEMLEGVTR